MESHFTEWKRCPSFVASLDELGQASALTQSKGLDASNKIKHAASWKNWTVLHLLLCRCGGMWRQCPGTVRSPWTYGQLRSQTRRTGHQNSSDSDATRACGEKWVRTMWCPFLLGLSRHLPKVPIQKVGMMDLSGRKVIARIGIWPTKLCSEQLSTAPFGVCHVETGSTDLLEVPNNQGIGHWARPCLSGSCLSFECPLGRSGATRLWSKMQELYAENQVWTGPRYQQRKVSSVGSVRASSFLASQPPQIKLMSMSGNPNNEVCVPLPWGLRQAPLSCGRDDQAKERLNWALGEWSPEKAPCAIWGWWTGRSQKCWTQKEWLQELARGLRQGVMIFWAHLCRGVTHFCRVAWHSIRTFLVCMAWIELAAEPGTPSSSWSYREEYFGGSVSKQSHRLVVLPLLWPWAGQAWLFSVPKNLCQGLTD